MSQSFLLTNQDMDLKLKLFDSGNVKKDIYFQMLYIYQLIIIKNT